MVREACIDAVMAHVLNYPGQFTTLEIAAAVGRRRQTVSSALAELRRRGLVEPAHPGPDPGNPRPTREAVGQPEPASKVDAYLIGRAFMAYRKRQGWKQVDTAALLEVPQSRISRFEAGTGMLPRENLINGLGIDGACTVMRAAVELARQGA